MIGYTSIGNQNPIASQAATLKELGFSLQENLNDAGYFIAVCKIDGIGDVS